MKRVFVGLGLKLEMGRGKGEKQVPRCARNDNLRIFRRVAEVWLWAAGRRRVVGAAGRRRVVGLGLVAGRAKLRQ